MHYDFYAYMDRMKYIKRWQLMRCSQEENIMEHSYNVALYTHALALIKNKKFGGNVDVSKAVLYALYHESSEVMTGDLPTPIKYYNHSISGAYKELEKKACARLSEMMPKELSEELAPFIQAEEESEEYKVMKAADRLAAYVKCLSELRAGNGEFSKAKKSIEEDLRKKKMPEVDYFLDKFEKSFTLTLDELESF